MTEQRDDERLDELIQEVIGRVPRHAATSADDVGGRAVRRWFRRGRGAHCAEHAAPRTGG